MPPNAYRIVLVEDDPYTRQRISAAVEIHPELTVVDSAGNCREGREAIEKYKPDVLLVDLGLPDGHGTELIRLTDKLLPQTEIMVITVFGDEKNVLSAIEAGATGYLLKDGDADYIGQSIKQMIDGGSPISPGIARHLLKQYQNSVETEVSGIDVPALTAREKEVLILVTKGFSYAEIASTLEMSVNTVNSHIKHIYRKLNVNSRGEAVFEATQLGIINALS